MRKRIPVWRKDQKLKRLSDLDALPIMRPAMLCAAFAQRPGTRLRSHENRWNLRRPFQLQGIRVRVASYTNMRDLHALFNGYEAVLTIGESRHVMPLEVLAVGAPYLIHPSVTGKRVEVKLKHRSAPKILSRADGGRGFGISFEVHGVRLWENEKTSKPGEGSSRAQSKKKTPRK